ncbi:MAG: transketolase C-terminal domain-containing protein [bacterium]|nr:transketolase C-terminal domain-containing protein [bacterium]MDZ4296626.1 transketolase C-terminal domain-containing protein [Patescibacteria group bacterium]
MPINPKAKLVENLLDLQALEQRPTRDGYGLGLVQAGDENPNVVALCADLVESTRTEAFVKKYPERFVEMGVQEQNMASVAAGMSLMGKIPYIASYAMFSPGRNWEQIRTTICYNEANVKICGAHAGVSVGPDGATHQAIEDMAIVRPIANMTVFAPCDAREAAKVTYAVSKVYGPAYIRYAREKTPVFTTDKTPFEIGKAQTFWTEPKGEKPEVAIIACGPLVHNALLAAAKLEQEGVRVRVLNTVSVKPLDEQAVIAAAKDAGAVITVEEHQVAGGMGSAVAETLARQHPVPIEFVGVQNCFGQSGQPNELIEHFGMGVTHIIEAVKRVLKRK